MTHLARRLLTALTLTAIAACIALLDTHPPWAAAAIPPLLAAFAALIANASANA